MGAQQAKPEVRAPPVPSSSKLPKGTVTAKTVAKEQKDSRALVTSAGNIFTEHNGKFTKLNYPSLPSPSPCIDDDSLK
jgi:hypothetical protein